MKSGLRPPEFDQAAVVLESLLFDLPGKLVAIDGYPGVGKTTVGRFLAWRFNVSLIETDLFLIGGQGRLVYYNDQIARIIDRRLDIPRPIIVEGCGVLRLLSQLGRSADFLIYVTNTDAPSVDAAFSTDLADYDARFCPRNHADLVLSLSETS